MLRKIIRILFFVVIIGAFIGTVVFLYLKSKKDPVVYELESPKHTNIIRKTVATGSVIPRKEIEIKPQVSGIIEAIYVEPGQEIKAGQKIAKVKIIPNMNERF